MEIAFLASKCINHIPTLVNAGENCIFNEDYLALCKAVLL